MNLIVLSGILFTVGLVGLIIIILSLIARMPNYRYKQDNEPNTGTKVYEYEKGWKFGEKVKNTKKAKRKAKAKKAAKKAKKAQAKKANRERNMNEYAESQDNLQGLVDPTQG